MIKFPATQALDRAKRNRVGAIIAVMVLSARCRASLEFIDKVAGRTQCYVNPQSLTINC